MNKSKKKFDLEDIIKKSRTIKEIVDEQLGIIRFSSLTWTNVLEISKKYPDPVEKSLQMLYRMLAPANPGLTIETIKILPWDVFTRLLTLLTNQNTFLPVKPNQATETFNLPKGDTPRAKRPRCIQEEQKEK